MNPSQNRTDEYQPKWTHFHTQSTVWVQNILPHDVIYQVADEHNNAYQYRLPAGKVSELPGGPVATLGVKAIVDELIQNNSSDVLRIYEPAVRAKYEEDIILRIKQAPQREAKGPQGEIDLSVRDETEPDEADEIVEVPPVATVEAPPAPEVPFPALQSNKPAKTSIKKGDDVAAKVAASTAGKLKPAQVIED